MRIGHGIDVHRLKEGRELIIGGVHIPHPKGLDGHSDADVLLHAVTDALFGAAALGDIGTHFPDTDMRYKGADSLKLLATAGDLIAGEGFIIENIDATIRAERPKMKPYIMQMRKNIADALSLDISQVSVKATTEEHLGFTGREEGIAAEAVCLLSSVRDAYSVDVTGKGETYSPAVKECPMAAGNACPGCGMQSSEEELKPSKVRSKKDKDKKDKKKKKKDKIKKEKDLKEKVLKKKTNRFPEDDEEPEDDVKGKIIL